MKRIISLCMICFSILTIHAEITSVTCSIARTMTFMLLPGETSVDSVAVIGYVTSTNGGISRGQQQFWMDDNPGTVQTFQAYWCNIPSGEAPLNVGDKVMVKGHLFNYNGQTAEIKFGDVVILERVQNSDTIEANVCEAITIGKSLSNNTTTADFYRVNGIVKTVSAVRPQYMQETFQMDCDEVSHLLVYNVTFQGEELAEVGDTIEVLGKISKTSFRVEIQYGTAIILGKFVDSAAINQARHVSIQLQVPGTLDSLLNHDIASFENVDSVTIVGSLNDDDINTLSGFRTRLPNLVYLDLFGTNITSLANNLFANYSSLHCIILPNSLSIINDFAFNLCSSLASIVIPDSVTSIGFGAFSGCCGLTSITIPNSVTNIGSHAFVGCGVTSIIIPNRIKSVGEHIFSGCTALESVYWNATNCLDFSSVATAPLYDIRLQLSSLTFGDSVEYIPNYLCGEMSNIHSITIPNNVASLGHNAFSGWTALDSINWNAQRCIDLTSSPFSNCNAVSFTFGDSVKHIPSNLCNGMNRLKEMTIPANVETIGENVFVGCDSLTRVNLSNLAPWTPADFISCPAEIYVNGAKPTRLEIPEGVTRVGAYAFRNCSQVTTIVLPPSVTEIGESAFANGSRLQTITLDAALETIGDSAFNNCPYLLTINANMAFPPIITSSVFANCGLLSGIDCYVPQGSLALYRKTAVWSSFNLHELATGLESTSKNNSAFPKKNIQNNQLYILLPDGTRYSATGQRVE